MRRKGKIHTLDIVSGSEIELVAVGGGEYGPKLAWTGQSGVGLALTPGGQEWISDAKE